MAYVPPVEGKATAGHTIVSDSQEGAMSKSDVLILAGAGLIVGLLMLNDPKTTGTWRTVAKYITGHSASALVGTLLLA